jgi:hypothetical protein
MNQIQRHLWLSGVAGSSQKGLGYNIEYALLEKLQDTKTASATPVFLACSFDFSEVIEDKVAGGSFAPTIPTARDSQRWMLL